MQTVGSTFRSQLRLANDAAFSETHFVVIDFEGTTPKGASPGPIEIAALGRKHEASRGPVQSGFSFHAAARQTRRSGSTGVWPRRAAGPLRNPPTAASTPGHGGRDRHRLPVPHAVDRGRPYPLTVSLADLVRVTSRRPRAGEPTQLELS